LELGAASSLATTTLRGLTRWYAGVETVANFTDAQVDGLVNRALHTFQIWIGEVYGGWKYSGSSTDTNLAAGTNNYVFPTDYLQINRIEINYSGNENDWHTVKMLDLRTIPNALRNLEDTVDRVASGIADVYILNNRFFLKRAPENNVTNGIRVYSTDIQTELSGTTDEPVFDEHFHKGLCMMAALDFSIANDLEDKIKTLQEQLDRLKIEFQTHESNKINIDKPRIVPKRELKI